MMRQRNRADTRGDMEQNRLAALKEEEEKQGETEDRLARKKIRQAVPRKRLGFSLGQLVNRVNLENRRMSGPRIPVMEMSLKWILMGEGEKAQRCRALERTSHCSGDTSLLCF